MPMEIVITLIYWQGIHDKLMEKIGHIPSKKFIQVWIHICPVVCMAINVLLSRVKFSYTRGSVVTFVVSTIFMLVNRAVSLETGVAYYFFLTWKDFKSVENAAMLVTLATLIYVITAFMVNRLPIPESSVQEENISHKHAKAH